MTVKYRILTNGVWYRVEVKRRWSWRAIGFGFERGTTERPVPMNALSGGVFFTTEWDPSKEYFSSEEDAEAAVALCFGKNVERHREWGIL